MGVTNATIKKDATAMTPTGGTDVTYSPTGKSIPSGIELQDTSVTDFTVRPLVVIKTRPPAMQKDGYYSKRKVSVDQVYPDKRADGTVVFSVVRQTFEMAVEVTAAQLADRKYRAAQFMADTDFNALWSDGVYNV